MLQNPVPALSEGGVSSSGMLSGVSSSVMHHSDRHTRFVLSSPNLLCTANRPGVRFCTPERFGSFHILDDFLKRLLQRRFDSLRRIDRCDHQLVRIYRSEIQIIPRIFC